MAIARVAQLPSGRPARDRDRRDRHLRVVPPNRRAAPGAPAQLRAPASCSRPAVRRRCSAWR